MSNCLIIFYKVPELSPVKTRLASVIGQVEAQNVYQRLVQYTQKQVSMLTCDKHVYYFPSTIENDSWDDLATEKHPQCDGDLGEKMKQAFAATFLKHYSKVVIIGTDCPELKSKHIEMAFECLSKNDVVIGPAADGGYYLLGMNRFHPKLFEEIVWSTSQVCSTTLEKCQKLRLTVGVLETLHDVDEPEDLKYLEKID